MHFHFGPGLHLAQPTLLLSQLSLLKTSQLGKKLLRSAFGVHGSEPLKAHTTFCLTDCKVEKPGAPSCGAHPASVGRQVTRADAQLASPIENSGYTSTLTFPQDQPASATRKAATTFHRERAEGDKGVGRNDKGREAGCLPHPGLRPRTPTWALQAARRSEAAGLSGQQGMLRTVRHWRPRTCSERELFLHTGASSRP